MLSDTSLAPPPRLHGDDRPQRNLRRWLWVSVGGLGASLITFALLMWGIYSDFLNDARLWLSVALVGLFLLVSLPSFPAFLAGMMHFRARPGKVIFWVSGLHALLVLALVVLVAYAIATDA